MNHVRAVLVLSECLGCVLLVVERWQTKIVDICYDSILYELSGDFMSLIVVE